MNLSKEILGQYVFTAAVNAGMMSKDLADKIKNYDLPTYEQVLKQHIANLLRKAENDENELWNSEHYKSSADTVESVLRNLRHILA